MTNLAGEKTGSAYQMDNLSNRNNRPAVRVAAQPQSYPAPTAKVATPSSKKPSSKKRFIKIAAVAVAVILLVAAAWFAFTRFGGATTIDSKKYQAVFFTNGQVYFGKLSKVNGDYMRLENVYYLQNKTEATDEASPQSASAQNASDVELIKLGNEIHGPEDEMLISKDQVLFFENLKPAGTVSQTITNFQKTKK